MNKKCTIQDIFHRFYPRYLEHYSPSSQQSKVAHCIINCKTGAYGTNELTTEVKNSRCVRAMGLLHVDSNGVPVLRVRNCEEVVWVPPVPRPGDNPYTADNFPLIAGIWAASAGLLVLLLKRRKK